MRLHLICSRLGDEVIARLADGFTAVPIAPLMFYRVVPYPITAGTSWALLKAYSTVGLDFTSVCEALDMYSCIYYEL